MIQSPTGLVDLHLHTTASDGRCTPAELVRRAAAAGVAVMAVTDHDTTAAVDAVQAAAGPLGVHAISGIEITAVADGRDVHVLGYFLDHSDSKLQAFLTDQREARVARVEAIGARLAALGLPVDVQTLVEAARASAGSSIGRPQLARALVAAGHAADVREAFDRWLGNDGPAFVPRAGSPPETVIQVIHDAGGVASLAHPGKTFVDERIPHLVAAGLDAVEAYHPDHDETLVARYVGIARRFGLMMTGGSDFHGDPSHGLTPGSVALPPEEWNRLRHFRPRHASS